jgi:aryl-alcohol dehydrogenase-like predicted oxidoreductase
MRALGGSGIEASVVAFGAWAIGGWMWGGAEEAESIKAIHAALDNGINLIDTAAVYGMGRSEEIVGKALSGGKRQQAVVATKCTMTWDGNTDGEFAFASSEDGRIDSDVPNPKYRVYKNNRPAAIRKALEDSLRRLRTDYIDLYQTHWQDATTPIEDTMHELVKMKKEGKIRAIGCCNASVEQMDTYRSVGQLDSDQERYNMIDRARESDNLPYVKEHNVAFLAYSPLAQGLLTGAIGPDRQFNPGDVRRNNPRYSVENRNIVANFLAAIKPVAADYSATVGQIVTAWTLSQPGCSHALLGARNPAQVAENARGGAIRLEPAAVEAVTKAVNEKLKDVK